MDINISMKQMGSSVLMVLVPIIILICMFLIYRKLSIKIFNFKSKKYKVDPEIDVIKLLDHHLLERKKNSFMLNEYFGENLSNINIYLDILSNNLKNIPNNASRQLQDLQEYIDKSIRDAMILNELVGLVKYSDESLNDNVIRLFKDFTKNYGIIINYKTFGKEKNLKESVNIFILEIIQDLLFSIVKQHACSQVEFSCHYGKKKLKLIFKCNPIKNLRELLEDKTSLIYYVIHTIKNRLDLLEGNLYLNFNMKETIILLIQIPFDNIICISNMDDEYEETKNTN